MKKNLLWVVILCCFGLSRVSQAGPVEDGWKSYHHQKFEESLEFFKKAINQNSKDADAYRGAAYTYFQLSRSDLAIQHALESEKLNSNLSPVKEKISFPGFKDRVEIIGDNKSLLGWSYYFLKNYDKAIAILKPLSVQHPDWVDAKDVLARSLLEKGKLQEAQKLLEEVQKLNAHYVGVFFGLSRLKDLQLAQVYEGWGYLNNYQYKKALASFNQAVQNQDKKIPESEMWRIHLGRGWAQYWLANYEAAEMNFKKTLELHADAANARKGLAYCAFKTKKFSQAITQLQAHLREEPGDSDTILNLGWSYYYNKNHDDAVKQFSVLAKTYPLMADPHEGLCLTYDVKGDSTQSRKSFEKLIAINPMASQSEVFKKMLLSHQDWKNIDNYIGWSFYNKGYFTNAAVHFEAALKKDATHWEAQKGFAFSAFQLGKNEMALAQLKTVLKDTKTDDERIVVLNTQGWANYNVKKYNDAIESFSSSLKLNDKTLDTLRGLGWSYLQKKDYKNSIDYFEKTAALYPLNADARNGLGWAFLYKENLTRAADEFDKTLMLLPGHLEAQAGLLKINKNLALINEGWNYYDAFNAQKAQSRFNLALQKLGPSEQWRAYTGLGWCAYSKGQLPTALQFFEKSHKIKSDDPRTLKGLGYTNYALKKYSQSADSLKLYTQQYPLDATTLGYLSWSYLRSNQLEMAKKSFEQLVEKYPNLPEAYGGLSLVQYKQGNEKEAHKNFITAVNLSAVIVSLPEYSEMLEKYKSWNDVYTVSGFGYLNSYNYIMAENSFSLALSRKSDDQDATRGTGLVHYYQRRYDKAIENLKSLKLSADEDNTWGVASVVLAALGWSYYYNTQYSESIDVFDQLARMHKKSNYFAEPHNGLGWNYLALQQNDKAVAAFEKALLISPFYASAQRGIANIAVMKK
ncbi:MAG: tetratricopeptide repeat protein [Deltaproteobacteria bacterium]|nr:tetratricopeptide repeat protein [Deltaproteobacteria bacterium]